MTYAERVFLKGCLDWALHSVGEGFVVPEDLFWDYSKATEDDDWETLPERMLARISLT